ncbi:hypothetical protein IE81DRAFT_73585 [Ceraceosorus guamensis]|uniref:Uncharacterized protein n=1 Tax=Ceraceosorus guamensis TaxID=1522189 RepID=A0A316VR00_9BASI|nr:hypothetical protein IE81DRAFT_73585 [Ceraceosorus guamensis]PWN38823.1 hypothetical protein IE81DRAFT_73585 [Ceraceosorus guamensis]
MVNVPDATPLCALCCVAAAAIARGRKTERTLLTGQLPCCMQLIGPPGLIRAREGNATAVLWCKAAWRALHVHARGEFGRLLLLDHSIHIRVCVVTSHDSLASKL